ncbi:diacylglycerol kinase family protein [Pigmentibacter sp. JX0631]|uniref:diacylglycerol/lipid kinase family protein n=1 Tax=Pigmentibacter sp. JX0631 TaxID=2976982 RepID=UPI00246887DF|nr:diacylglycerol kinase family protein [Pigmentibacter sp. JX0631]WGL61363.1 diacylglycerol kinase family protein [Pigmentibacter sp. JX0631]
MLRVGIISNPFAKIIKQNPEYNTRLWYTLAHYGQMEVTHSVEQLRQVCLEFHARKINLVGIVGGDGSISLVLSALYSAYGSDPLPKILLLKGGTINFLAKNLGIKTEALTCLEDTLKIIHKKQALNEAILSTLHVNGRLGFIFANGIATSFLEEFYKDKTNSFGAAIKITSYIVDGLLKGKINGEFKKIVRQQKMSIETFPEKIWQQKAISAKSPDEFSLIFASTVKKLPLTNQFFKKVKLGDEYAEMIAISEKGKKLIKGALKSLMGGDIYNLPHVYSVKFKQAHITSYENSLYSLDGDLLDSKDGKIEIEMGPNFVFCSPYEIAK